MTQDRIQILLAEAKRGDRDAFDELLELHRGRLEAWTRTSVGGRIRHRVEVEDLLQETCLRAFQSLDRFTWRHEDSFLQWLCTIARHLIWNASQKRTSDDLKLTIEVPAGGISPSREMRRDERFDRLEESLAGLKPEEREAILLSRVEGLKIRQIAERMNRSEPAVKSLIARSLARLKKSIGAARE